MDREKAYEVATRMYQGEAERWAKNALGLLGALLSVFLVYHYIHPQRPPGKSIAIPFFVASIVSGAAVFIALSIRESTDTWRDVVKLIEIMPPYADVAPFILYNVIFHRGRGREKVRKDLQCIFLGVCEEGPWAKVVPFSVTRLYALLAGLASVFFFFLAFISLLGWMVGFIFAMLFLHVFAFLPSIIWFFQSLRRQLCNGASS